MTLEECIYKAEIDAARAENDAEWNIEGCFADRTEALEYASMCRDLVKWLKELSEYKNMTENGYKFIPIGKIRAEIEEEYGNYDICEWTEDFDYDENNESQYYQVGSVSDILQIIDDFESGAHS